MRYGRDPKPHKGRRRRSGVRIVNARLATTRERSRSPARWIRKLSAGWCAPAPWGHQSPRSGRRSTNSLRHSRRRFEDRHPGRHPGRERRGRFYATPGTPRNRNCRCRRQTAELHPCLAFLASVQIPLSFHVFLTNTMGFVPRYRTTSSLPGSLRISAFRPARTGLRINCRLNRDLCIFSNVTHSASGPLRCTF